MSSAYRTPVARAPRCAEHPEDEATVVCARCRAALCDACCGYTPSGVSCPGCAGRRRRLRSLSRACVALVATCACVLGLFAVCGGAGAPLGKRELRALEAKAAVRSCDEAAALLSLLHFYAEGDDRAVLGLARDFGAECGQRPMVLAMAYRGACQAGDGTAASAVAARLEALPAEVAPSWRGIACPALRAR